MLLSSPNVPQDEKPYPLQKWTVKSFLENFITYERNYLTHGSYYLEVEENGHLQNQMAESAEPDLYWMAEFEETQKFWFECHKCRSEFESYVEVLQHLSEDHADEIINLVDQKK